MRAMDAPARTHGDWTLYRRLLGEARPHAGGLAAFLVLTLVATPLALLIPLPLKVVVDQVLGEKPVHGFLAAVLPASVASSPTALLTLAAVSVVAIAVLLQVHGLTVWALETWLGDRLVLDLRAKVFRHLQRLSLTFHEAKSGAEALYRVQQDAPSIRSVLVYGGIPFVGSIVKIVVMLFVTARIDGELTLVALCAAPPLLLLIQLFRKRLRANWTVVREHEGAANAVVRETLAALRVVKAFVQEDREHDRYVERGGESIRAEMRAVRAESLLWLVVGLVLACGTATVLWIGAQHVRAGALTTGNLLLVMAYLTQLYEPLRAVGNKVAGIQKSLVGADRVFALLDTAPDVVERPGAVAIREAKGAIRFEGVAFGYDKERPLLSGVTLDVPAGARVGIAGPSGSGKTTFLSLLPRFHDPTAGRILLDGLDLRDARLKDLRLQFAIVLQEPVLFSTTIRENIAYGRPEASEAEIAQAARSAGAHEFIEALPEKYDTQVGDRGLRLSGGERQRISLARAFLKDAPILLLDEPTSSVDVRTESVIMDAIERLMSGRTTFIIAHRLSTLDGCDLRLLVQDGTVVAGDAARRAFSDVPEAGTGP